MRTPRLAKGTPVTHGDTRHVEVKRGSSLAPVFTGAIIALMIVLAGMLIPSPYIIEKPGPVVNTLGEIVIDGETQPVIRIDGEAPHSDGELNLLTVSVVGSPDNRLGWFEIVPALFNRTQNIVRMERFFAPGQSSEDRQEANQAMMQNSQTTAIVAALRELGEPVDVTVTVVEVGENTPADGVFAADDVITQVNGLEVQSMSEVRDLVAQNPEDQSITLTVERDGETTQLTATPEWIEQQDRGLLGIIMTSDATFDEDIAFDVDRIGGPSAGMIFSLAIVEELTEGSLIGDTAVSGTGTVDDGGNIGGIGGLPQKMWAALGAGTELFLMPVQNCADVPEDLPERAPGMEIVPIETLHEAVEAIRNHGEGTPNPGLERCATELAQVIPVS